MSSHAFHVPLSSPQKAKTTTHKQIAQFPNPLSMQIWRTGKGKGRQTEWHATTANS